MRVLVLVLSLLVGAAAPAWAQSPPADWKTWRYPDLHLVFRAPPQSAPTIKYDKIEVAGGEGVPPVTVTNDQIVAASGDRYAMMVGVSDWNSNTRPVNIEGVASGATKAMKVEIVGGVRTLPWRGGEAREYDARSATMIVRSRIIVVNRRLYQAMVLTFDPALPPDTDAFLASVRPQD